MYISSLRYPAEPCSLTYCVAVGVRCDEVMYVRLCCTVSVSMAAARGGPYSHFSLEQQRSQHQPAASSQQPVNQITAQQNSSFHEPNPKQSHSQPSLLLLQPSAGALRPPTRLPDLLTLTETQQQQAREQGADACNVSFHTMLQ